jgi:hypothetical protein
MIQADSLRLMFNRFPVNNGLTKVIYNGLVDGVALGKSAMQLRTFQGQTHEIFNCGLGGAQDDRRTIIRQFPFWLGIYSDQIQLVPPVINVSLILKSNSIIQELEGREVHTSVPSAHQYSSHARMILDKRLESCKADQAPLSKWRRFYSTHI